MAADVIMGIAGSLGAVVALITAYTPLCNKAFGWYLGETPLYDKKKE